MIGIYKSCASGQNQVHETRLDFCVFSTHSDGWVVPSSENPCWKTAMAPFEMNRCADSDFRKADAKLNRVYKKTLQFMVDDLADARQRSDEEEAKQENTAIASLKHAERAWLLYRDVQCKAAADYDPGSISPMIYAQCLRTVTEHRIADLKSIYEGRGRKLD